MKIDNAMQLLRAEMTSSDRQKLAIRLISSVNCQSEILKSFRDDDMDLLRLFKLDIDTIKDYYFSFHEELTNRSFKQWGEWSTCKYGRSSYVDHVPPECDCVNCKNEREYYLSRVAIMGRAFDLTVLVNCDSILEELEELIIESKRLRGIHDNNYDGCLST